MNEKEFIERVKKELLVGYYPGENGKPERLPADYVEELIQKKNWLGTSTLLHEEFMSRDKYKSDKFWVEGTANTLWTLDNC